MLCVFCFCFVLVEGGGGGGRGGSGEGLVGIFSHIHVTGLLRS